MIEWIRSRARAKFAQRVMRAIAAAGGPDDFEYDAGAFTLKRPDAVAQLRNTYEAIDQAKGDLKERIFANFIAGYTSLAQADALTFDTVKDKLVAVVRERIVFALMDARAGDFRQPGDPEVGTANEPWTDWFATALVIDFPTHVMLVTRSHLKEWGVTFDEAFALGLGKLRESTVPKFREEDGVWVGMWNDDFDSSRILIAGIFDDLPLKGEPVVCLPNRLTLLVAGSDDPKAVKAMLERAENVARNVAKPQNPAPLLVRDGRISDYNVESSSPIFNEIQRARRLAALLNYQEQQADLEQRYKQTGKACFIAKYTLSQTPAGDYCATAVWSKGVPTLLPKTDVVMFFDENQPEPKRFLARAKWSDVQEIVGDLMLDTKLFPPRFYVSKFPSDEQLKRLNHDA